MQGEESQIEKRLQMLGRRAARCVCKACGNALEVRIISFGRISEANAELFCPVCNRLEFGTEPEIYHNAVSYVDVIGFDYFDSIEDPQEKRRRTIGKVCELMEWNNKKLGILDNDGFTVDLPNYNAALISNDGSILLEGGKSQ